MQDPSAPSASNIYSRPTASKPSPDTCHNSIPSHNVSPHTHRQLPQLHFIPQCLTTQAPSVVTIPFHLTMSHHTRTVSRHKSIPSHNVSPHSHRQLSQFHSISQCLTTQAPSAVTILFHLTMYHHTGTISCHNSIPSHNVSPHRHHQLSQFHSISQCLTTQAP